METIEKLDKKDKEKYQKLRKEIEKRKKAINNNEIISHKEFWENV